MTNNENKITECQTDLLTALRILDEIRVTAWHKVGTQEFRCNMCGGIGSYPRTIDHHSDCTFKPGIALVEKYHQMLIDESC